VSGPGARVPFGFRFVLIHLDGEPADPGMFVTAIPIWKAGDEFLAGPELVKFRILDVDIEQTPGDAHGVFTVEAVEG
jgi:hypothetical protein